MGEIKDTGLESVPQNYTLDPSYNQQQNDEYDPWIITRKIQELFQNRKVLFGVPKERNESKNNFDVARGTRWNLDINSCDNQTYLIFFRFMPTDSGLCYSFNAMPVHHFLTESTFSSVMMVQGPPWNWFPEKVNYFMNKMSHWVLIGLIRCRIEFIIKWTKKIFYFIVTRVPHVVPDIFLFLHCGRALLVEGDLQLKN